VTDVRDSEVRENDVAVRGPRVLVIASESHPARYAFDYVAAWNGKAVGPYYFNGRDAPSDLLNMAPEVDFAVVQNDDPDFWFVEMRAWIKALNDRGIPIILWSDHVPENVGELVLAQIPFWPRPFGLLEAIEKHLPALYSRLSPRDPAELGREVEAMFAPEDDE
jgi:hypothetical protein